MAYTITPELKRIYHLNYIAKPDNRLKLRCRERCAYAIKTGKLIRQPCQACGNEQSEAHHEDYSKPLDVKWLCRKHHAALHRGQKKITPGRKAKTHCDRGHPFEGWNLMICGAAKKRKCRTCNNAASQRRRARKTT
jgi:hypothetical protein